MSAAPALRPVPDSGDERPEPKAILTPAEAARLLGKSKSWACAALAKGLLPGVRDGSRWLVRLADLRRDGWL